MPKIDKELQEVELCYVVTGWYDEEKYVKYFIDGKPKFTYKK